MTHWLIHVNAEGWADGVLCGCAVDADHYEEDETA